MNLDLETQVSFITQLISCKGSIDLLETPWTICHGKIYKSLWSVQNLLKSLVFFKQGNRIRFLSVVLHVDDQFFYKKGLNNYSPYDEDLHV